MRLIDADALKEEFTCKGDEWICNIIDNEPTIEPKTKVIAQVTFDENKLREIVHESAEQIKEEYDIVDRPKGEWMWYEWGQFYCSECGHKPNDQTATTNFCPNCGADMRGADDE